VQCANIIFIEICLSVNLYRSLYSYIEGPVLRVLRDGSKIQVGFGVLRD
jgi:hypothetical protein